MAFTGYLKFMGDEIGGESQRTGHEGEIDVWGVGWKAEQASSAATGSGRTRGRAKVYDFEFRKWYDASSPYTALACMKGTSFDEVCFTARKDSGDEHIDYLKITMSHVIISSYQMGTHLHEQAGEEEEIQMIEEVLKMSCETIGIEYVEQATDHSAGGPHPIEYSVPGAA